MFNNKSFNISSQYDKEELTTNLIHLICNINNIKTPDIYFNKEEQGVNGSFYCIDEPFINIHIEPGMTPYRLLKTIIHETYHYQQYCFNIDKENEIINGLKNPVNYDPFYFAQEHEIDARDYTAKQLAEAAKVISDPEFDKLMQQDIIDDEMAMKRYQNDIINKIPILNLIPSIDDMSKFNHFIDTFMIKQERKSIIQYTDLISKYPTPFIHNKYEYYDLLLHNYNINVKLADNKSVFNISIDEQKHVTLIAEGNQANLFFSGFKQNDKIKNLDTIYSLVGNLIQIHNFENEIQIDQVKTVPFVEGLTKNGSFIFNKKNKISEIVNLSDLKINEKDFFYIQEQISTKYLNELISHQIGKDGDLYFHATENNFIMDKLINRLYFYYKEHFSLAIDNEKLLEKIADILRQHYNKSTCTSYFNIQNFSDILLKNDILKQLSIDEKLEYENKINDFVVFKDNNYDISHFMEQKDII